MRRTLVPTFFVLLTGLIGCRAERVPSVPEPPGSVTSAAPANEPSEAPPSSLAWGDKIAWRSWESAQSLAKSQDTSICVVVYAEWCARCKELAPVFEEPAVASAASKLVMVRQDQDRPAAWLKEQLGAFGDYVPRVLFVSPDGKVREDLTSGHPRYPHFYGPMVKDQLVANMRAAVSLK
jgi:thiol:disulfide interchange protein